MGYCMGHSVCVCLCTVCVFIVTLQVCVLLYGYVWDTLCVYIHACVCVCMCVMRLCIWTCICTCVCLCSHFVFPCAGENINICWSPDGSTIAVGNKDDLVTFIDVRSNRSRAEEQFKFEVNEISWNNEGDLFFLTSGNGSIHIFRYSHNYIYILQ